MKPIFLGIAISVLFFSCSTSNWEKSKYSLLIHPTNAQWSQIQLTPVHPNVIQICTQKKPKHSIEKSHKNNGNIEFSVKQETDHVVLSTSQMEVIVSLLNGDMQFKDKRGVLFSQTSLIKNKKSHVQVFQTEEDELFYKSKPESNSGNPSFLFSLNNNYGLISNHPGTEIKHRNEEISITSENNTSCDYFVVLGKTFDELLCHIQGTLCEQDLAPRAILDLWEDDEYPIGQIATHSKSRPVPHYIPICNSWEQLAQTVTINTAYSFGKNTSWSTNIDRGKWMEPERFHTKDSALHKRLVQLGTFSPIFHISNSPKQIATCSSTTSKTQDFYTDLRQKILPYIYSIYANSYHHNSLITKSIPIVFNNDRRTLNIDNQYMLGPSLLVNPVYKSKAIRRDVYFPNYNGWYDLYTGKYVAGGQKLSIDAPLDKIPVFVREGSIIPTYAKNEDNKLLDSNLNLFIYTGKDASFELYQDDGVSEAYKNGAFSTIHMHFSEKEKTLTINDQKGEFKGMKSRFQFNIIQVSRNMPYSIMANNCESRQVEYKGKKLTINL